VVAHKADGQVSKKGNRHWGRKNSRIAVPNVLA
jgi:hypothetical protein